MIMLFLVIIAALAFDYINGFHDINRTSVSCHTGRRCVGGAACTYITEGRIDGCYIGGRRVDSCCLRERHTRSRCQVVKGANRTQLFIAHAA